MSLTSMAKVQNSAKDFPTPQSLLTKGTFEKNGRPRRKYHIKGKAF